MVSKGVYEIIMTDDSQAEQPASVVSMSNNDLINILVVGGIVGLLVWGFGFVMHRYIFDIYLCQNEVSNQCAYAKNYAAGLAALLVSFAALTALVRFRVYRPLLVLIAAMVSMWGVVQLGWSLAWYQGSFIAFVLYALAFGGFSWVARVRDFWITLIIVAMLVVAVRLAFAV